MKPGDLVTFPEKDIRTFGSQSRLSPLYGNIYMIKEIHGSVVVLLGITGWIYQSEVELIYEIG